MAYWHGKGVEGKRGIRMSKVRIGVVGMELLHSMLLKLKGDMGMCPCELCPDENILNIIKKVPHVLRERKVLKTFNTVPSSSPSLPPKKWDGGRSVLLSFV